MVLPSHVQATINTLEQSGHEAFVVGGCVRDSLLGLTPYDYDVTTSATPEEMKAVFTPEAGFRTHDTGIKHGTITVISNSPDQSPPIEVTTFRIDGEYSDTRRPDTVEFTRNLKEDLSRRDFTVNAMAYSGKTGIVDCFDGRKDLALKLIRAVGESHQRFTEDGLRILRALRFAAVYDFTLEPKTAIAARELKSLLQKISSERIMQELNKLICGNSAGIIIENYADIFGEFIPQIVDLSKATLIKLNQQLSNKKASNDRIVRLSFLLAHLGEMGANQALRKLNSDNNTRRSVVMLIKHHGMPPIPLCKKTIKLMFFEYGVETFFRIAHIRRSDEVASMATKVIADEECYSLKQLAISGSDLIELKIDGLEGAKIGEVLKSLLLAVINEECENTREKLLELVQKMK
ncbi:MAG: CCA tRNA nucleotidyltransferase [Oscillospiraceae bacterium]|nr:CCA tRNA nucleotidyltransferase [Oscillospiraceae bacterium]